MADPLDELARDVALACRILARQGLVREIIGHVSARIPGTDEMFIRCRGEDEYGLAFTSEEQIRRVDFDGQGGGLGERHVTPLELPIHGETYRARPDVGAVVHGDATYFEHGGVCHARAIASGASAGSVPRYASMTRAS